LKHLRRIRSAFRSVSEDSRSHRLIAWLRPAVLVVASVLVLGAAFVTADDAAHRVTEAAGIEAARSAETTVRASVDPLLAEATMGDPDGSSGRDIDALLERLVQPGGIARIKLWSPSGTILFSDLATLRGRAFDVDDDLEEALAGETASQLHLGGSMAEENLFDGDLPNDYLEIYLPVRASNGTVIGAYEIYEDATSIVELIEATRRDVFIVAGLAATVLLLMLWGAFNATSRTLASQNGRLVELAADLRGREARFRSLLQNSSDAQAILDADGRIRFESVALERILGYPASDWEGRQFASLVHDDDRGTVEQALADLASGQGTERRFECRVRHADGTWRTMEAIGRNLLDDPAVGGIVINHRDITERKVLEAQLTRQAFHDALTGLPNRALFTDRVSHALRRRARQHRGVVVLFVDLDDFKAINDSLGHAAGDRVLQEVGERLRTTVRPGDTVARLGGDEFAFLLEDVPDPRDADEVAERVAAALATPLAIGGVEVALRASVGIALAEDGDAAADLLRDADTAMYTAKARGGGAYERFVPAMREAAISRFELGADLRRAIERREFVLHYQPVVDLTHGRILGFEALVRWQHPTRGLLAPAAFVPTAEATGLIVAIGRWVLEEACVQAHRWQLDTMTDPKLSMSANLSARELREPGLVENVAAILQRTGVDPSTIVLEITETSMVEDADGAIATLQALKALGVRLAIDDFGTGYSSLSYLRRLPVDVLKLDRSFVVPAGRGDRESALVDAVFRLGRSLGLVTIAEGIEDAEQRDRLVSLGCRVGQGYLFARPMAEPAASEFLVANQSETADAEAGDGRDRGAAA
jgi:diguanylate cyclase (GGDEF)-like protein/PAS domain S-box-containing protein